MPTSAQQANNLITSILNVVGGMVLSVLGIQTGLLQLPVNNGDKRFNQ